MKEVFFMDDTGILFVLTFLIDRLFAAGLISEPSAREIKRQITSKNARTRGEQPNQEE